MWSTKGQIAERYAVSIRTIDNWMRDRKIPYVKLSERMVRFKIENCDEALQTLEVKAIENDDCLTV